MTLTIYEPEHLEACRKYSDAKGHPCRQSLEAILGHVTDVAEPHPRFGILGQVTDHPYMMWYIVYVGWSGQYRGQIQIRNGLWVNVADEHPPQPS